MTLVEQKALSVMRMARTFYNVLSPTGNYLNTKK